MKGSKQSRTDLLEKKIQAAINIIKQLLDENAYLKEKTLYIECKNAEDTEALRYEQRNIKQALAKVNIFPDKIKFRTKFGN